VVRMDVGFFVMYVKEMRLWGEMELDCALYIHCFFLYLMVIPLFFPIALVVRNTVDLCPHLFCDCYGSSESNDVNCYEWGFFFWGGGGGGGVGLVELGMLTHYLSHFIFADDTLIFCGIALDNC
jgi:hypothetical protein